MVLKKKKNSSFSSNRLRYNSEQNLRTTNPSQHTTITTTPWIIRHLALKRLISTLYRHNFNPHGRSYPSKGWQLSHLSLRHLSRTSLARVILASILICFHKNFFCCDRILFGIFHSFLTFTLEEPRKSFCRSGSQTLFFGGREATTGNASAVRRLHLRWLD